MSNFVYEEKSDNKDYVYFRYVDPKYNHTHPGIIGPHFHNAIEFKIVTEGKLIARVSDRTYELKAGDMVFVKSLTPHHYNKCEKTKNYDIVISLDFFNNVCPKGVTLPEFMPKCEEFDLIKNILERTWAAEWSLFDQQRQRAFVYSFLGTVLQYYKPIKDDNKQDSIFLDVMQFIEKNYMQNITIDILSNKFGYSKAYFSNRLHKLLGMNFKDYINRFRISAAIEMKKKNKDMPMYVIAEKVGFNSWNTFYRSLKKFNNDVDV